MTTPAPDNAPPTDYSYVPARKVIELSMADVGCLDRTSEPGVDYSGVLGGVPFCFVMQVIGGRRAGTGKNGFQVASVKHCQRTILMRRGRQGHLAGVLLQVRLEWVQLWIWVPWDLLENPDDVVSWGDLGITDLGPIDGLINFAAVPMPETEGDDGRDNA